MQLSGKGVVVASEFFLSMGEEAFSSLVARRMLLETRAKLSLVLFVDVEIREFFETVSILASLAHSAAVVLFEEATEFSLVVVGYAQILELLDAMSERTLGSLRTGPVLTVVPAKRCFVQVVCRILLFELFFTMGVPTAGAHGALASLLPMSTQFRLQVIFGS